MELSEAQRLRAEQAIQCIEGIGGTVVWERELCAADLSDSPIDDVSLEIIQDLPMLEILNLSNTIISDHGLRHLHVLRKLELLVIDNTKATRIGIEKLLSTLPRLKCCP